MTLPPALRRARGNPGARLRLPALLLGAALLFTACEGAPPTALEPGSSSLSSSTADGTVLVGFAAQPGDAEIAAIEALGGTVTHRYQSFPIVAASVPESQLEALAGLAGVTFVQDNLELKLLSVESSFTAKGKQITDYGVRIIDAPGAWEQGYRGQNVKVGIFDTGIALDHPDLVVAGGIDLIGDGNGYNDCQGHGTHVAGIVGATNNGNGTVGVAPRAQLYAMRLFNCVGGGATEIRQLKGLDWAILNKMQVINMSFGCCYRSVQGQRVYAPEAREAQRLAMQAAADSGIVLVAATGNDNAPVIAYPAAYPSVMAVGATDDQDNLASFSNYGAEQEVTAPGALIFSAALVGTGQRTTLTVDTDSFNELSPVGMAFAGLTSKSGITREVEFFGLGSTAEFEGRDCGGRTALISRGQFTFAEKTYNAMKAGCAAVIIHNNQPGNFNGTLGTATAPNGQAWIPSVSISLEEGVYLHDQMQQRATTVTLLNVMGDQRLLSGTSMASPHAAGVAALVLSKNPTLSPAEVRAIMRNSADDKGVPGPDPQFGYGRINARRAVQQ